MATDQQTGGLAVSLAIDRVSASRLGIAPSRIDNTLYDAFGQRQINTMYTQLNQYHVILEAQPNFSQDPEKLNKIYIQANASVGRQRARRASTSFSASASATAGSNATTTSALYTPSSGILAPPANALLGRPPRPPASSSANTTTSSNLSNAVPLSAFAHIGTGHRVAVDQPPGAVPFGHRFLQPGAECRAGQAIDAIDKVRRT